MRLAKAEHNGLNTTVVLDGNSALRIADWRPGPVSEASFDAAAHTLDELTARLDAQFEALPLAPLRLAPPIAPTSKVICLGLNYRDHVEETQRKLPSSPSLFTRMLDSLVGHEDAIIRPSVSEQFDYEGELCVVIGKAGRHIAAEDARSHVFGYTIMVDGSVRDYQRHSTTAGKNFWRSGSLGPWIATADEVGDAAALSLETRLNGQVVQNASTGMLIFDIPTAIEYISRWTPLAAGDVIATGTPAGVGLGRTPPLWMKAGDVLEVEISRIGALRNVVADEPAN